MAQNTALTVDQQRVAATIYHQAAELRDEMEMTELQRQLGRAFSWYATSDEFAGLDEEERQHISRYYMAVSDLMGTIEALIPENNV